MKFGSLFDGIGGFIIAFERAGMECLWSSENDKHCNAQMEKRYPNIPNLGDVRNVTKETAEPVSLICGGFPCQDLSVAGRREGLAGERSGLWFEFLRVITELSPEWVVIENVPGLLSSDGGRDFAILLRGLVEFGYGVAWRIFDAQYFGVAQRRRRVFIVGSLGNGRAAQVLFEREGMSGNTSPSRKTGEGFASVTGTLAANCGGLNRPAGNANELDFCIPVSTPIKDEVIVVGALTKHFAGKSNQWAPWNEAEHLVAMALNSKNNRYDAESQTLVSRPLAFGKTTNHNDESQQTYIPIVMQGSGGHEGKGWRDDGASFTLNINDVQAVAFANVSDGSCARSAINLSPPLTNRHGDPNSVAGSFGVRRLTPLECERLQGFPDRFTEGQSDTQRYKQLGNAVAVPVVQWIGERIMEVSK